MYQNIMLFAVLVVLAMVVFRVYQSWQTEKSRKPAGAGALDSRSNSKTRAKGKRHQRKDADTQTEPYHCVTLVGDCPALKSYKNKRFLASNAPPLPVPDCTAARCNCHYTHHSDRRKPKGDRRALGRLAEEQYVLVGNEERRKTSRGRRKTDVGWASIDEWSKMS
ncbi:hypothetical protein F0M18_17305 [Pseudohalioglobus sediminis]|uniref:Uncharacterized protein n=1 Tax=Pseudohalioglobus sediminis TaxID=2606449 RepID=A0A5B0WPH3_9GAMM|nr:hypothetical protein [Pseudohalioglobus sediminis]KAA1188960.1 hypothetical protein F0M18_17305 [Pseudohalioglobus sediminis]